MTNKVLIIYKMVIPGGFDKSNKKVEKLNLYLVTDKGEIHLNIVELQHGTPELVRQYAKNLANILGWPIQEGRVVSKSIEYIETLNGKFENGHESRIDLIELVSESTKIKVNLKRTRK